MPLVSFSLVSVGIYKHLFMFEGAVLLEIP